MTMLITAADYSPIAVVADDANLPRLCREAEEARSDGYCVFASRDGRIVADADGYAPDYPDVDPFDLACERRHD